MLLTTDLIRLDYLWNLYNSELNKITFKPQIILGKDKAYKILNDSFNLYRENVMKSNSNTYDTKDLIFSFASMAQIIEINKA